MGNNALKRRAQQANPTGRTKAVYGNPNRWVGIPWAMARSEAFRSLSGTALKWFVELRSRYSGRNNGELSVSCEEAANILGMGKATALRAQRELARKGFIVLTRRGTFRQKLASEWALTDRPADNPRDLWLKSPNTWEQWKP